MKTFELANGTQAQVAEYTEQDIHEYQNPLIEALPPIYSQQDVIDHLSFYPAYRKEERYLEDYKRVHLIQRILYYFQPLPLHLQLCSSIDRLLRFGYVSRNPLSNSYAQGFVDNSHKVVNKTFDKSALQTGQTMSVIGISGVGKTRSLQRILDMYPRVISHTQYKGKPLNMYQVTYLTIQTPFDGSVKTIIYDFMYQVDLLMGTNYFNRYANSRLSTSQLMPIIAQIARSANLGCLIIDEIQHLKAIKSKSSTQILNFFTTLINTVNVPIIMVGTPKSMDILQSQFRQARRNTNIGNVMWNRLEKDEIWELFIQGMWKYQWTKEIAPFNEEFSTLLYRESQGIADIAVKLFMMVQLRAISNGEEKITINLINNVSQEELKIVQPMIQALRNRNYRKLADYEDLTFPNIEEFLEREQIIIDQKQIMNSLKQGGGRSSERTKLMDDAIFRLGILGIDEKIAKDTVSNIIAQDGDGINLNDVVKKAFNLTTPSDTIVQTLPNKDFRGIVKDGRESGLTAYQSLKDAGFIKVDYSVSDVS